MAKNKKVTEAVVEQRPDVPQPNEDQSTDPIVENNIDSETGEGQSTDPVIENDIDSEGLETAVAETPKLPANNIIFVGQRERNGIIEKFTPPLTIRESNKVYELPNAETQLKGFYHEDAKTIIHAFPHLYKPLKIKGA